MTVALALGVAMFVIALIGLVIKLIELGRRQANAGLGAGTPGPKYSSGPDARTSGPRR